LIETNINDQLKTQWDVHQHYAVQSSSTGVWWSFGGTSLHGDSWSSVTASWIEPWADSEAVMIVRRGALQDYRSWRLTDMTTETSAWHHYGEGQLAWLKGKEHIGLHGKPISELQNVNCRKGSQSSYDRWPVRALPPDTSEHTPPNPAKQAGTVFTYPGGMEGWVDMGGWLHTKIVTRPQMVTHPSTNWARRRVTTLIETNVLSLSHATTTSDYHGETDV